MNRRMRKFLLWSFAFLVLPCFIPLWGSVGTKRTQAYVVGLPLPWLVVEMTYDHADIVGTEIVRGGPRFERINIIWKLFPVALLIALLLGWVVVAPRKRTGMKNGETIEPSSPGDVATRASPEK